MLKTYNIPRLLHNQQFQVSLPAELLDETVHATDQVSQKLQVLTAAVQFDELERAHGLLVDQQPGYVLPRLGDQIGEWLDLERGAHDQDTVGRAEVGLVPPVEALGQVLAEEHNVGLDEAGALTEATRRYAVVQDLVAHVHARVGAVTVDALGRAERAVRLDQPLGLNARETLEAVDVLRVEAVQEPLVLEQAQEVVDSVWLVFVDVRQQVFGEREEGPRIAAEVVLLEDGLRIGYAELGQVVVEAGARRAKVGYAAGG